MRDDIEELEGDCNAIDLKFSDDKSKWFTNDVIKLRNSIRGWNNWEVSNRTKLLGLRFSISKEFNLDFKDQYDYALPKFVDSIDKLKFAYSVNTFMSTKEGINMVKSFCTPIID